MFIFLLVRNYVLLANVYGSIFVFDNSKVDTITHCIWFKLEGKQPCAQGMFNNLPNGTQVFKFS